jgi:hypothetical protein
MKRSSTARFSNSMSMFGALVIVGSGAPCVVVGSSARLKLTNNAELVNMRTSMLVRVAFAVLQGRLL